MYPENIMELAETATLKAQRYMMGIQAYISAGDPVPKKLYLQAFEVLEDIGKLRGHPDDTTGVMEHNYNMIKTFLEEKEKYVVS